MKAYYAHTQALYNTKQEARDLETIKALGFEAVNPNDPEIDAYFLTMNWGSDQKMAYFEQFADSCDLIVFRALPEMSIPSGVGREIKWFQDRGKPVIELPHLTLRNWLDRDATRGYFREIGYR